MRHLKTICLAVVVAACVPPSSDPATTTLPTGTTAGERSTVIDVTDGDTIEVEGPSGRVLVRLDGVNAPDLGECHHGDATRALEEMIGNGSVIVQPTGTDQFGRVLAMVRTDSVEINGWLVSSGHAIATTPLFRGFASAERDAMRQRLGLWGSCGSPTRPDIAVGRVVYDPPGPDDAALSQEAVEIVNRADTAVDLSGWVLRDESSRHRFHFPSGTRLLPGSSMVVRSSDGNWDPGGSPVWNNNGDIILLQDRDGQIIAVKRY